ncbi:histone-lysine N-methyltransferase SETMAR [Nephila pilipes]|uniref:Histone-lysine N-methyltransferase SETMAR n=1 Tax=Nephila pilipes TaxID=299642 RepID=A0A8X6MZC9_NEPPI|nr:histone-lysine N-methyltransferase SETMAR [Nephila pilipes]
MIVQKLNELGYETLSLLAYPQDRYSIDYDFFKHPDNFQQKNFFNNQTVAQNAIEKFIGSRSPELCAVGINRLVYCWQKYIDYNGF